MRTRHRFDYAGPPGSPATPSPPHPPRSRTPQALSLTLGLCSCCSLCLEGPSPLLLLPDYVAQTLLLRGVSTPGCATPTARGGSEVCHQGRGRTGVPGPASVGTAPSFPPGRRLTPVTPELAAQRPHSLREAGRPDSPFRVAPPPRLSPEMWVQPRPVHP